MADFLLKQINTDVLDELSAICARFEHVNEKVSAKAASVSQPGRHVPTHHAINPIRVDVQLRVCARASVRV